MSEIPDLPVYSKHVLELITVANDYCMTMVKASESKKSALINYLLKVAPLLYLKTSLIPEVTVENPEANERFMTEEEWEGLFNTLRSRFGKEDEFWFVDPSMPDNEIVKGSLAEHFTDIYQDLYDFLKLYQKNSVAAKENAVHEIRKNFIAYWGFRLVNAHRTLHHLSISNTRFMMDPPRPSVF